MYSAGRVDVKFSRKSWVRTLYEMSFLWWSDRAPDVTNGCALLWRLPFGVLVAAVMVVVCVCIGIPLLLLFGAVGVCGFVLQWTFGIATATYTTRPYGLGDVFNMTGHLRHRGIGTGPRFAFTAYRVLLLVLFVVVGPAYVEWVTTLPRIDATAELRFWNYACLASLFVIWATVCGKLVVTDIPALLKTTYTRMNRFVPRPAPKQSVPQRNREPGLIAVFGSLIKARLARFCPKVEFVDETPVAS